MERLLALTGGRPLKNEDALEYLQAFEILEEWFNDIGMGDCVVYGCDIVNLVPFVVGAGVIYYNGKLRIFDGDTSAGEPMLLDPVDIDIKLRTFDDDVPKYTAQLFKMVQAVGGAFSFYANTPHTKEQLLGPSPVKTKIIDLGDWDMNVSVAGALQLTIAHGIADFTKIRSVKAMILADDDSARAGSVYDFESPGDNTGVGIGATGKAWDVTNVYLRSIVASFFDHADFNKLAFNRGHLLITYVD